MPLLQLLIHHTYIWTCTNTYRHRETDRQTDRQTDRRTDTRTDLLAATKESLVRDGIIEKWAQQVWPQTFRRLICHLHTWTIHTPSLHTCTPVHMHTWTPTRYTPAHLCTNTPVHQYCIYLCTYVHLWYTCVHLTNRRALHLTDYSKNHSVPEQ